MRYWILPQGSKPVTPQTWHEMRVARLTAKADRVKARREADAQAWIERLRARKA